MAELAVSIVVEKLANLLIEETVFLDDVRDQVVWIQRELRWMQSFLKDVDAKQERDGRVKEWVADIREAAYDAEDVIDTFIFKVASHSKKGFGGFVKRYVCILNRWAILHGIGKEIATIRVNIMEISRRKSTYGITDISAVGGAKESERLQQLRRSSPYAADDEFVVGLTEEINVLVAELMKEDERRCVISIVGMGGVGKTTLARKIYNHGDVMGNFSCRAWVSVSKEYRTIDILQGLIKNVLSPTKEELEAIDQMTEYELERKIHEVLGGNRYLVVLDDIWNIDAWDGLKNALPNTWNRSRVILTTRIKEVALYADVQTSPLELQILGKDESWELFCRKAFPENNIASCPTSLEEYGRAMVDRCGGLPLALLVLGGLLSTKNKSPIEWERVLNNIRWHLTESQDGSIISAILGLSYNDLPHHLKSCFLHLGLFPENVNINVIDLIQYWPAEGIIPQEGEEKAEVVAENYLNKLIDRSLVQVVERTSRGRAKACRVHDLLHDLSVSKAKDENMVLVNIDGNLDHEALLKSSRRCAVHAWPAFLPQELTQHLRTLIFFNKEDRISLGKEQMRFICRRFKLLRVLDLRNPIIKCLPSTIGNLVHLRYLSLDVTYLGNELPPSIGNLLNLQYLQIENKSDTRRKMPNVIWKMEQLRHLCIHKTLITSNLRIDTLKNLQLLKWINAEGWTGGGNSVWDNLTNLVDLRICGLSISQVEVLFHSGILNRIHSLSLGTKYDETFPTLPPLPLCPCLLKLEIEGRIEKLFDLHELPPKLTKLSLVYSGLKQDSMVMVGNLPNLQILILGAGSYMEKKLVFIANGFPQLQVLEFRYLHPLEEWRVEEGALIMLRHLVIHGYRSSGMIPERLRFMTTLKELIIRDMPEEFEDELRGVDWYKVQHIPSITIDTDY